MEGLKSFQLLYAYTDEDNHDVYYFQNDEGMNAEIVDKENDGQADKVSLYWDDPSNKTLYQNNSFGTKLISQAKEELLTKTWQLIGGTSGIENRDEFTFYNCFEIHSREYGGPYREDLEPEKGIYITVTDENSDSTPDQVSISWQPHGDKKYVFGNESFGNTLLTQGRKNMLDTIRRALTRNPDQAEVSEHSDDISCLEFPNIDDPDNIEYGNRISFNIHRHAEDTTLFWSNTAYEYEHRPARSEQAWKSFFEVFPQSHLYTQIAISPEWQSYLYENTQTETPEFQSKICETLQTAIDQQGTHLAQHELVHPLYSECITEDEGTTRILTESTNTTWFEQAEESMRDIMETRNPFPPEAIYFEREDCDIESVLIISRFILPDMRDPFFPGQTIEHIRDTAHYDAIYILDDYAALDVGTSVTGQDTEKSEASLAHLGRYLLTQNIFPENLTILAHGTTDNQHPDYESGPNEYPGQKFKPMEIVLARTTKDHSINEDESLPAFPTKNLRSISIASCLMTDSMADHIAKEWSFTGEMLYATSRLNLGDYESIESNRFPISVKGHVNPEHEGISYVDAVFQNMGNGKEEDTRRAMIYNNGVNVTREVGLPLLPPSDLSKVEEDISAEDYSQDWTQGNKS